MQKFVDYALLNISRSNNACIETLGKKLLFEKALIDKRIKKFFCHIKTVKPYYKVKNWELDYQKQVRVSLKAFPFPICSTDR
jgi:hypothetical protein